MPRPCRDVRRGRAGSRLVPLAKLRLHDASRPRHAAVARLWRRRIGHTRFRETVSTRRRRLSFGSHPRANEFPRGCQPERESPRRRRAAASSSAVSHSPLSGSRAHPTTNMLGNRAHNVTVETNRVPWAIHNAPGDATHADRIRIARWLMLGHASLGHDGYGSRTHRTRLLRPPPVFKIGP
jgi:hypothetical protein